MNGSRMRANCTTKSDLPAGSFETHFTFAQALTESAKLAKQCLLVISLPASDTTGSPHAIADDVEVGGERGRAHLTVCGMPWGAWKPRGVRRAPRKALRSCVGGYLSRSWTRRSSWHATPWPGIL